MNAALCILKEYLPKNLFSKLKKYVTSSPLDIRSHLDWNSVKKTLDQISLDACCSQLIQLLSCDTVTQLDENNAKVFHIQNNHEKNKHIEPTPKNVNKMIFKFLATLYQRNMLASVIKYILLKPIINMFENSTLMQERQGIFYSMHTRLLEIVFESNLLSFNGSNYDNYLLCNSLVLIQTQMNEKIYIFKKGASISTVKLTVKKNIQRYSTLHQPYIKSKQKHQWTMNLYIKDIRNLVAANMSLDKIGKLFNLTVPKLAFPYDQATSVLKLKTLNSLHVNNSQFWKNTFSAHEVPLESRLEAQRIYDQKKFLNLYEYSVFYLQQDCVLLHSIALTLFFTYCQENINIFIRRNFSQSNLSYQQFFVVEPSQQINKLLAPKKINNTFYNYFIRQAVAGGLCTSFVHGKVTKTTVINDVLNYIENPNLNSRTWPNFAFCPPQWKKAFTQTPAGIQTIDIRSLYPSASVKKLPVNIPLLYTRFTKDDHDNLYTHEKFYRTLNLRRYCQNVRRIENTATDRFQLISERPRFYKEYYALVAYLSNLPNHIEIVRFQSNFTAFGQLKFCNYFVDGFLTFRDLSTNKLHIKIIQFHSVFYHGHTPQCYCKNSPEEQIKYDTTANNSKKINDYITLFKLHFNSTCDSFELVEITECDFKDHQVPLSADDPFMPYYKTNYSYHQFIDHIYNKKLHGLLVVKNLEIAKNQQNPIMGFCIQKIEYDHSVLSPYTQEQIVKLTSGKRVVAVHKTKNFMIISTEYFTWLRNTFGFETEPVIYHALVFQLDDYLRKSIESKLIARQNLKNKIKIETNPLQKQNYEVKAELIKLMLNSCYGFTLCNINSKKFKKFTNRRRRPKINCVLSFKFLPNVFLVQTKEIPREKFTTMLGHVGCYILFNSKIILLKRLYFLLSFLDPRCAQLLYMDTDSAHLLVKHSEFVDNVTPMLKEKFRLEFDKHFETGDKISGIWVSEGFYEQAEYLGEKCYRLYNLSNSQCLTHMKGLNAEFQRQYHQNNQDSNKTPYLSYNNFFKSPDFLLFKTHMSKNLFTNYVPNKRYFVFATGSLPLKF